MESKPQRFTLEANVSQPMEITFVPEFSPNHFEHTIPLHPSLAQPQKTLTLKDHLAMATQFAMICILYLYYDVELDMEVNQYMIIPLIQCM